MLESNSIQRGQAVVLPEYRSPDELGRPFSLQDGFCALAWAYASADTYGFDTARIVILGFSAGGLIAGALGTVDDASQFMPDCPHALPESGRIRGVATYAAVFGTPEVCLSQGWCLTGAAAGNRIPVTQMLAIFEELQQLPPEGWLESADLSEDAAIFAQTLPAAWVDGSEPPFLIIHGTDDDLVPADESEAFANRLKGGGR